MQAVQRQFPPFAYIDFHIGICYIKKDMTTAEFNYLLRNLTEEDVFEKFYKECFPLIIKYSYHIFRDKNLGRDIAQDIFGYLFTHKFIPYVKYPRSWLYTLCKNTGLKYINKEVLSDEIISYAAIANDYDDSELNILLDGLEVEEREIVEMHYILGFSLKEIANFKGRTYAAVLKQHNRILKKIKKKLSKKS